MKVVIDTNVLVSAVLRDRDPEAVILFVLEQDNFTWVVSDAILTEYRNVLARKRLGIPEPVQQRWLRLINTLTSLVVQKTPETLVNKGFSTRLRIWDFSTILTKAMGFSRHFDRLGCPL